MHSLAPALAALTLLTASCGGAPAADAADARPAADAGPTDFRPDFAGQVRVMEGQSGTAQEFFAVRAWITDKGLLPAGELLASDGECAIYIHPEPGDCQPACSAGYCNASDQCEPFPEPRSAGTITVGGLSRSLAFTPTGGGYDSPFVDGDLFADGDPITISADGDQVDGFEVELSGVAPLVADNPGVSFESGAEQVVTWTAENSGRVQLALIVGWHLAPYEALVLCESDDDGSLTITSDLIAQVPRQSSFLESHASTMARFDRAIVASSVGPIEVVVGHQIGVGFSHFPAQ